MVARFCLLFDVVVVARQVAKVVNAGVPTRTPEVYQGPLGSKGTLLRLAVIIPSRSAISACRPVNPNVEATLNTSR